MHEKISRLREIIKTIAIERADISEANLPKQRVISVSQSDHFSELEDEKQLNSSFHKSEQDVYDFQKKDFEEDIYKNLDTVNLKVIHEDKILMKGKLNDYNVLGPMNQDLSCLRITLMVEERNTGRRERIKIDLYEREFLRNFAFQLADLNCQNPEQVESELLLLTDLLEKHRDKQLQISRLGFQKKRYPSPLSPEELKSVISFLSQRDMMENLDKLIEKAGVIGEENTRKLLLVIASTYKMCHPLHVLVQGSSGSGKSHLIKIISQCIPPEDVISLTRVTSKSFYHYNKDELVDKLILIQDYDGMEKATQFTFKALQNTGGISSSTTHKDRYGNLIASVKMVRSHFASLSATSNASLYSKNTNRSIIIGVDESEAQTFRIVEHQNKQLAGLIDQQDGKNAKKFIQNCMRCLKPYEVVNRYADKVYLPVEAKMLRKLNSHFQAFVNQITILHQYQRQKDEKGRLIAEPQDLKMACDILFDAIILKVDELDSSLRQFFDRMKEFIKKQAKGKHYEFQFTQRDVRLALNFSKTQCFRYMEDLEMLEYIQKTGGYANRGFKYKIVYWDDMEKIRTMVKKELNRQLDLLKLVGSYQSRDNGTPEPATAAEKSRGVPKVQEGV